MSNRRSPIFEEIEFYRYTISNISFIINLKCKKTKILHIFILKVINKFWNNTISSFKRYLPTFEIRKFLGTVIIIFYFTRFTRRKLFYSLFFHGPSLRFSYVLTLRFRNHPMDDLISAEANVYTRVHSFGLAMAAGLRTGPGHLIFFSFRVL